VFFVFIPYLGNLIIAANVKNYIRNNEAAKAWFQDNTAIFVLINNIELAMYQKHPLKSNNLKLMQ